MFQMMKVLVKCYVEFGIWMEEVFVFEVGLNEVLIKLEKIVICGIDLYIYKWDEWSQCMIKFGFIIGYEFVGCIVEMGLGVIGYSIGDCVLVEGYIVCGYCCNCCVGCQYLCLNMVGIGVNCNGVFVEYMIMLVLNLWLIFDQILLEFVVFFDLYGNVVYCVLEFDVIGEDVLIIGVGLIGIIVVGICKYIGVCNVVVIDVNDYCLKFVVDMGVICVVNVVNQLLCDVVKDLYIQGFDVGLEMSGNLCVFNDMFEVMYYGGKVVMFGIMFKGVGIDWDKVIFKGFILQGIYGCKMYEIWYKMIQMVFIGFLLQKVFIYQIVIDDFQCGFDLMDQGICGKVVCSWS